MTYKDYTARIEYDESADMFHGRVLAMLDVIDFYGTTPSSLRKEFKKSVNEYLKMCKETNTQPEKPFSGKFTLRTNDEKHRRLATVAGLLHKSLNSWAIEVLDREAKTLLNEN